MAAQSLAFTPEKEERTGYSASRPGIEFDKAKVRFRPSCRSGHGESEHQQKEGERRPSRCRDGVRSVVLG